MKLILLALFLGSLTCSLGASVHNNKNGSPFGNRGMASNGAEVCKDATQNNYLTADPLDCHKFYSCVFDGTNYLAYHFTCPATLAFDDNSKNCDYEDQVESCSAKPTQAPEPTTTQAPEPTTTKAPEPTTTEAPKPETTKAPETTTTEEEEPETTEGPEPETTQQPEPEPETTQAPEPETTHAPEPETTHAPEPETTQAPETTTTETTLATKVICEHKQSQLSCEEGKSIQVVSAFYGRQNRETCPSPFILTTDCKADRTQHVQSLCEGQTSCTVASNNQLGDPCRGTFKYTEVSYKCQ